ncbi:rod shape-determining protein [Candidatus Woesebacteria bacterium RIFCSPHIGHO2_01_FULL_44_21]|uniref:Cell shape-determining protein MreB n=1 Tax=Candidatus Woesebacteria bacterium RIFCSPHIGHO2_01_FULL_44_21 TaxID=1802503 RepID=A0A1F7YXF5_9BACT|nr:MAG: rod shape-determining protein [Candidatus Woesebacteria bacterium RIFCSPHIGHO2_01_FULL_44_21]
MFGRLLGLFSDDIGIDLGTANTLVYVVGKGILIREPSAVARNKKTKEILAIGMAAKKMMGRTPQTIESVRPLKDGVIADFDATAAMLTHYVRQVNTSGGLIPKIPRPRVIVGIPSGVTEVERRAVADAAIAAGARKAYLVEEPMAAAIGAGLAVEDPRGIFIVDIGGGTTEIAVISLGGIVLGRSVRIAGDEMDEAIMNYFRLKYALLLGQPTAENLKIQIGSFTPSPEEKFAVVRGRDLETGLPKSMKVSAEEVREALSPVITEIVGHIKDVLEEAPPELVSDAMENGIVMAGGGSLIPGIDKVVREATKTKVIIAEDAMTCVARGCGLLLINPSLLAKVNITAGLR